MDNKNILILLLISVITIISISQSAFQNGKFRCKNFMLNTYLYLILSITIIALSVIFMDDTNAINIINNTGFGAYTMIFTFIFGIGLVIALTVMDASQIILKHILWIIMLTIFAIPAYLSYLKQSQQGIVVQSILGTIGVLVAFSGLVYFKPKMFLENYNAYSTMFIALLVSAVFMEIGRMFMDPNAESTQTYSRYLAYGIIALFAFLISFDTQTLVQKAKRCNERSRYQFDRPDYISDSLGLLLDVLNIYNRMDNM
jgi:hypothetical protein